MSLANIPPRSFTTGDHLHNPKKKLDKLHSSKSSKSSEDSVDFERNTSPSKNDAYEFFNLQKLESQFKVLLPVILIALPNLTNKNGLK